MLVKGEVNCRCVCEDCDKSSMVTLYISRVPVYSVHFTCLGVVHVRVCVCVCVISFQQDEKSIIFHTPTKMKSFLHHDSLSLLWHGGTLSPVAQWHSLSCGTMTHSLSCHLATLSPVARWHSLSCGTVALSLL